MTSQFLKYCLALALMLYMPLILQSCRQARKPNSKHSDTYLKQRVEQIYDSVFGFYNKLDSMDRAGVSYPDDMEWPQFDRLYCSEDWNRQLDAMSAVEEQNEGTYFYDLSYWLGGTSFDTLSYTGVEVIDQTGDTATVSFVLCNGGMRLPMLLNMTYERGDWYIDEMTSNWNNTTDYDHITWKHAMRRFAETNGAERE
ncbi:MAG: hypothetical protein II949_13130 [Prevotella sp.]|nr:hypothetical protein [Prevotella sp.]